MSLRVAVLTAVLLGSFASPAAAAPITLDEGLGAVGSAVRSVVEPPGGTPPSVPELPVVSAKPPETGSVEREVAEQPAPQPHPPSSVDRSVERSGASDPVVPVPGSGSLERAPDAEVAATSAEARSAGAASGPAQGGAGPGRSTRSDPRTGSSGSAPGSIRAAVPAPLEEWLAHLWPAVALSPLGSLGSAVATQVAGLDPARLLRSLAGTVLPSSSPPNGAPAGSGPEPVAPSAPAASPGFDPFFSPHSGGMGFLVGAITVLAALAGLVSFARLLVGEDFFSLRWLR